LGLALVWGTGVSPAEEEPAPSKAGECGQGLADAEAALAQGRFAEATLLFEACLDKIGGDAGVQSSLAQAQEGLASAPLDPDPARAALALTVRLPGPWDLPDGAEPAPEGTVYEELLARTVAHAHAAEWSSALLGYRQAHTLRPDCVTCREQVPLMIRKVEDQLRVNYRQGARMAATGQKDAAREVLQRNLLLDPVQEFDHTRRSAGILEDITD